MDTPKPDITFEDHGSIAILQPRSGRARLWVAENVDTKAWQFGWGTVAGGIAIERRYAAQIARWASEDGLQVAL